MSYLDVGRCWQTLLVHNTACGQYIMHYVIWQSMPKIQLYRKIVVKQWHGKRWIQFLHEDDMIMCKCSRAYPQQSRMQWLLCWQVSARLCALLWPQFFGFQEYLMSRSRRGPPWPLLTRLNLWSSQKPLCTTPNLDNLIILTILVILGSSFLAQGHFWSNEHYYHLTWGCVHFFMHQLTFVMRVWPKHNRGQAPLWD